MISAIFLVTGGSGGVSRLSQQRILVRHLQNKGLEYKVTQNVINRHQRTLDYTRVTIYLSPLELKRFVLKEECYIGRLYKGLMDKDPVIKGESVSMSRFLKRFKNPDFELLPVEDFLLSAIGLPEKLPLEIYFDKQGNARDIEWALVRELDSSFLAAGPKGYKVLASGDDFIIDLGEHRSGPFPWQVRIIKKIGERLVLVGISMGQGDKAFLNGSIFNKTGEIDLPLQVQTCTQGETNLSYLMNYTPPVMVDIGPDLKPALITSDKIRLRIATLARAALKADTEEVQDIRTSLPPAPPDAKGDLCEIGQRRILVYQLARMLLEYVIHAAVIRT